MLGRTRIGTCALLLGSSFVLANCSDFANGFTVDRNVAAAQRQTAAMSGGGFNQELSRQYTDYATGEYRGAYDYTHANFFAKKAQLAASGAAVLPEEQQNWSLPPQKRGELSDARARLMAALDGGARERAPQLAARAQRSYDCWIEQQSENWQINDIAGCRAEFLQIMSQLEQRPAVAVPAPAPTGMREFRVFFDWDRSDLTPEGRSIIDQAAQQIRQGGNVVINLVGKADRSGTNDYNLGLSQRRATTVRNALLANGLSGTQITQEAVGEGQPEVPTDDGVREPRNRVVNIRIR